MFAGVLPSLFFLAHAAVITSFGLAMATWFRQTGRAVAVSVAAFVLMAIGWPFFVQVAFRPLLDSLAWGNRWLALDSSQKILQALIALSPIGGQTAPFDTLQNFWNANRPLSWTFLLVELAIVALAAAAFLGLTLLTFNRCMGRMNEGLGRTEGKWLGNKEPRIHATMIEPDAPYEIWIDDSKQTSSDLATSGWLEREDEFSSSGPSADCMRSRLHRSLARIGFVRWPTDRSHRTQSSWEHCLIDGFRIGFVLRLW